MFIGIKKKEVMEDVLSFCTRNDNMQDVAHGAFNCTIDYNSSFIVPSWIRSMNREDLCKKHMLEKQDQSCSRSYFIKVRISVNVAFVLFTIFYFTQACNLISKKDLQTFAGLNNVEVDAKESTLRLKTFLDLSEKYNLSLLKNNSIDITKQELNDLSSSFRQHAWDNLQDASETQTHCINHCLGNDNMPICDHDHRG